MQKKNWWLGATALTLALSAPMLAHAQDDNGGQEGAPAPAAKADKTHKTAKPKAEKKDARAAGLNKRTKETLEAIWGQPLTPAQETAIAQAAQEQMDARKAAEAAYKQKVAAALGTTVEDYDAKDKAYRDKLKAERDAKPKEAGK
jgi:hypothetical protein